MISQDDAARTAERLADALTAAAEIMAESDAAAVVTPVRQRPGRLGRARGWLIPIAAAAGVIAIIAVIGVSVLLAGHLGGTPPVSQPTSPGAPTCQPFPAAGSATAPPQFYVTTDVAARQIQLQVRRTSDCAITAVVSLPAGWVLTGGISAAADDRTFFAAAFSARCPAQQPGSISTAAHRTRFFRFTVNDQGQAGRLTMVGPAVMGLVGSIAVSPDGSRIAFNAADANYAGPGTGCSGGEAEGAAISVVDLATGKIRTWQTSEMPPAPAGTSVTPHEVSWLADGRTDAGRQLRLADKQFQLAAFHCDGRTRHKQQRRFATGAQPPAVEPAAQVHPLRAGGTDQPRRQEPHSDRDPADRGRLPYRPAADLAPVRAIPRPLRVCRAVEPRPAFIQDGSGQHAILMSGSQAGWVRAGKLLLLRAPASALALSYGITTIAW